MEKHGNPNQPQDVPYAPPKTVGVRDEAGNRYEATYMRRAKGLVKNGRARFADESQSEIILTCPPNQHLILEDKTMTELIMKTEENAADIGAEMYSYEYALRQIELICHQMDHIHLALSELGRLDNEPTPTGGSARFVAESMAEVVKCRETTTQKLIDFYAKMYEDLKPRTQAQTATRAEFMEWVRSCIAASEPGLQLPDFEKLWKMFN